MYEHAHMCRTYVFVKSDVRRTLGGAGEDTGAPYLTLRRLAVWVSEPLQRLKTLAALADAVVDKPGGQLISALHAATKHGEPAVSATVSPGRLYAAHCIWPTMWVMQQISFSSGRHEFMPCSPLSAAQHVLMKGACAVCF